MPELPAKKMAISPITVREGWFIWSATPESAALSRVASLIYEVAFHKLRRFGTTDPQEINERGP